MVKIGRLDDSFLEASKPSKKAIPTAKRKEKKKKGRGKKIQKSKSLRRRSPHLKILISAHARAKRS